MRVRRCSECGTHTMEERCPGCESVALSTVYMSHGDRTSWSRPIQIRRMLGFGLLNAAIGQRLADEIPAAVPGARLHHG